MRVSLSKQVETDVLIIGSGLAGLLLALELARLKLRLVIASKGSLGDSNTSFAQGGLAAVTVPGTFDSVELHLEDTIKAGAGLTDEHVARLILEEGSRLVDRLGDLGMSFDVDSTGGFELAREGGHSRSRVLHSKDATGRSITKALIAKLQGNSDVLVLENALASELLLDGSRCCGARLLVNGEVVTVEAGQVALATGGVGQVFERTTNPSIATGDGIALAYRAGARLIDMEFVQFHPTALHKQGAPAFLISEAVRGAGAVLLDKDGLRFAGRFHPDAELATRDVVARGIYTIMREQNIANVWLDLRPIGKSLQRRFPNIVNSCLTWGVDPAAEPVPISPAAHYFMGGIWTDTEGRTSLPGLYALGECASIGLHGANRLASNSLLEAGVMALRVSRHIALAGAEGRACLVKSGGDPAPYVIPQSLRQLRSDMYRYAGLERHEAGLQRLLDVPTTTAEKAGTSEVQSASMLLVGQLIARSALARSESRGAHWRSDFPASNPGFRRRFHLSITDEGWLALDSPPVPGKHQIPLAFSH